MNAKNTRPHPAPMITLGDIYYIVFRHKKKIALLGVLGLVGAFLLPFVWPQSYQSEAKLLIKYVADTSAPAGPSSDGSRTVYVDSNGRNIINTEMHILSSLDLAQEVATNVTAAKILGMEGTDTTAAAVIHGNMLVDNPDGSDVIRIRYTHKDPAVAQMVLAQVVKTYLEHHSKIYHPLGTDDIIQAEKDQLATRLKKTEDDLAGIKTNLDIVSFEDSPKIFGDQIARIQQELFEAQSDLAQQKAVLAEMTKRSNESEQHYAELNKTSETNAVAKGTNEVVAGTNTVAASTNAADASTNLVAQQPPARPAKEVSPDTIADYRSIRDSIASLKTEEKNLLKIYLPENSYVKEKRAQIAAAEQQKKEFEQANPGVLLSAAANVPTVAKQVAAGASAADKFDDVSTRIAALQMKIQMLTEQLNYVHGRSAALDAQFPRISELERTRKIEADNYNYFLTVQLKNDIDQNYGSKSSNINVIQTPSAPSMDRSKLKRAEYFLAVAGILFGLGLAFLIEMYLDRTVKRPVDIEAKLGVPLFLSIPYRNGKGSKNLLAAPSAPSLTLRWEGKDRSFTLNGSKTTIGTHADSTVVIEDESVSEHHCEIFKRGGEVMLKDLGSVSGTYVDGQLVMEATLKPYQTLRVGKVEFSIEKNEAKAVEVAKKSAPTMPPWDPRHALRPFYDTLRDRLITYFEVKNLTHNPKLVALTSCGDSAGVTSTAAGLAAALSETGEGNVLLVDMNVERGAAHHFYKGHLSCGIDEALKKDKRDEARVQNNLYVVTESSSNSDEDSLPRVLPKRFTSLVPKLKASDYDYIIFDMPPMSQISITPRLARFMDMVMVVVESEKTDREVVQRAVNMLTEARANVGVVLNKRKKYVPKQLQQEL
jgi:uncharacterized protein involved in exopolysaccharide biosynthesis/Mrp family chromosome partitioning ATPase